MPFTRSGNEKSSNRVIGGWVYMYPRRLVYKVKAFIFSLKLRRSASPQIGADALSVVTSPPSDRRNQLPPPPPPPPERIDGDQSAPLIESIGRQLDTEPSRVGVWSLKIKIFIFSLKLRRSASPQAGAGAIDSVTPSPHSDRGCQLPPPQERIDGDQFAPSRLVESTGHHPRQPDTEPSPVVRDIAVESRGSTACGFTPESGKTISEGSGSTTTQHPKPTYTTATGTPKAPCSANSGLRQEKIAGEISWFSDYKLKVVACGSYVVQKEHSAGALIESIWDDQENISRGGAASVWRQRNRKGGQLRAVKAIPKHTSQQATRELLALITLNNYDRHFVKFLGWYDDIRYISIVMEYIEGGDLGEYICRDPLKAIADAKEITRQILKGLEILHKKKFCHRDIKPPNILIVSFDPIWLKIADFGVSKLLEDTTARTGWGTGNYRAPEILNFLPSKLQRRKFIGYALDIWSLGCLVHELLTSQTPFHADEVYESDESGAEPPPANPPSARILDTTTFLDYCKGSIEFPVGVLEKSQVNIDGIAFVKSLLIANPKDRPTATHALQDPWLKGP